MKFNKESLLTGFALFALFFGAGNLILPPILGFFAGTQWYLVTLGFVISAVGLPLLGILAHARLQGTILSFGDKISPVFSLIFSVIIYLVSISLPAPRTAAVTHEIAIQPFFDVDPLVTSIIYFFLVFLFVFRRSEVINNTGKYLTPAILFLLLAIIIKGIFSEFETSTATAANLPVLSGFFEGYQTFDAIAALVVGGVIIVSVKLKGYTEYNEIRKIITTAAVLAGFGLLLVYGGLIYNGAIVKSEFPEIVTRTELLSGISFLSLGSFAQIALALLVTLACFTTAVGIVTGTADFLAQVIKKRGIYPITVTIACILGVVMGALSVNKIIEIALPVLMIVYPVTIVLIVLNVLPANYRTKLMMTWTVTATIIFTIPDALKYMIAEDTAEKLLKFIPLSGYGLGWVLPALLSFLVALVLQKKSG